MTERWRDIPGFEGRYQASDLGRVRSVPRLVRCVDKRGTERQRLSSGRVLKPGRCRGYLIVNPHPGPTIAVHILVARAFVPNPNALPEVNHKDGVKHNCAASNLEWATRLANQLHAVDLGLNTQATPVIDPRTGVRYPSIAQAARKARLAHRTVRATWARAL